MNAPSTEFAQPLAAAWVERIFMRLHGRFGNPFLDKFRAGQIAQDGRGGHRSEKCKNRLGRRACRSDR